MTSLVLNNRALINSSPVSCLYKDFILGNTNAEEKWFLSRDGAWDGTLNEDLLWGSCRVKRCSIECMFV